MFKKVEEEDGNAKCRSECFLYPYLLQKKKELKSVAMIKGMQFDCIRQQIAEQGRL